MANQANLKPLNKETAAEMAAHRAELRANRETITFNRSNVLKKIFSEPLSELTRYSKQFRKVIESKFENIDNLTVFEAIQLNAIMHYLSSNDPRIYDLILNNAYGKLKEETEKKVIEIPVFQDPISLIQEMDDKSLKMLFASIQHRLVEPEPISNINNLTE